LKQSQKDQIAGALGAARVVDLGQGKLRSPLDMLALRREFDSRLRSSGGRPTDPEWTVSRQVPFKDESWSRLKELADEVGLRGSKVGPAQVAALLIESSLEQFEEEQWQEVLSRSRRIPLHSQPEASDLARVTYNQFDDWVQRGWIRPAARKKQQRFFSADEIMRGLWLRSVALTSEDVANLAMGIQSSELSDRYLVVADTARVLTVPTRAQLYRLLETVGSHLVIDQLPERNKLLGQPSPVGDPDEERIQKAI
jgi:hypothetical protein